MMVALGCVAAIQLDEGGSSTYISQREGEQDVTMRNTPAGGSERGISGHHSGGIHRGGFR